MKKKIVTVVLILVILLTTSGLTYSGWGPVVSDFGSIIVSAPGHPWGEPIQDTTNPPCYRPNSGGGSPNFTAPTFTNFVLQFYLKYVVKKVLQGQNYVQKLRKGE